MPIISKVKTYVPKTGGRSVPYLRVITVSAKGIFSIVLPEHVQMVTGAKTVESNTLKDMETLWQEALDQYSGVTQEDREKFILVDFSSYSSKSRSDEEISRFTSRNFSISHELLFKIRDAWYRVNKEGGVGQYTHYDNIHDRGTLIPWTKEYEDFFVHAEEGVDNMIIKIRDFLKKVKKNPKFLDKHLGKKLLNS